MRFFKSRLLRAIPIVLCSLVVVPAMAQPANPNAIDDAPVPITGLEYLLIAGGALGGYKLFKKKQQDNDHTETPN